MVGKMAIMSMMITDILRLLAGMCIFLSPLPYDLQAGAFPHYDNQWAEWNGRFRDTVRAFIKVQCLDFGWMNYG